MTLRIVLMSDVHGNLPALRAVVDSLPEYDTVVVAGDLCLDGPNPGEVLDLLDELGWSLLMGNTDQDIVAPPEELKGHKAKLVAWTRQQLGPSRLRRLASLDFSARFTPTGGAIPVLGPAIDSSIPSGVPAVHPDRPGKWDGSAADVAGGQHTEAPKGYPASADDTQRVPGTRPPLRPDRSPADSEDTLLVVHANPRNLEDHLRPTMSEGELRPYLTGIDANMLAFGHLHTPYVRPVDEVLLLDVASVGHPKDHDLRASYCIVTWDNGSRSISQRRVPYDVEETLHRMRHAGMPDAEKQIASLLEASY